MIALSAWIAWRASGKDSDRELAFIWFFIQLAIGVLWSVAFFAMHSPGLGLVVIMAFLIAIDITIVLSVNILGGNRSDVVKVSRYAKKDVVGYRLPASPTASAAAEP